jgi:hypothetical protein
MATANHTSYLLMIVTIPNAKDSVWDCCFWSGTILLPKVYGKGALMRFLDRGAIKENIALKIRNI